jgi:hypothetical protein
VSFFEQISQNYVLEGRPRYVRVGRAIALIGNWVDQKVSVRLTMDFSPGGRVHVDSCCINKTLEQLVLENNELRQTAANLLLQTAILRESLTQIGVSGLNLSRSSS